MDKTIKTISIVILTVLLGLIGYKTFVNKEEPIVIPEEKIEIEEPLIPQKEIDEAEAEIKEEEMYGPDLEEKI